MDNKSVTFIIHKDSILVGNFRVIKPTWMCRKLENSCENRCGRFIGKAGNALKVGTYSKG